MGLILRLLLLWTSAASAWAAQPADTRKKLVLLIAGQSYAIERTLPAFVEKEIAGSFQAVTVGGAMAHPSQRFEGMEEIADADLVIVSVWRRAPPEEQLALLRRYVASGRPIVGIATASHAFSPRANQSVPAGGATWPEWDADVIGGSYTGHHPARLVTTVTAPNPAHRLLEGVELPFRSQMELNRVRPLRPGTEVILVGDVDGFPSEPVAWTFLRPDGGRTFFTPLGHPEDFAQPAFRQLLRNGILWAAGFGARPPPSEDR